MLWKRVLITTACIFSLISAIAASYVDSLKDVQLPLRDGDDLQPIVNAMAGCRLVLLGEGSHGSREFYTWRAEISKQLIADHGFSFVAVEGDWNALRHLDDYVRGRPGAAASAREALLEINRWPLWMWSNEEFADFGEWLREFNRDRSPQDRVGVYGIDVYGMWDSLDAVLAFYAAKYPGKLADVEGHYGELSPHRGNNSTYVQALRQRGRSGAAGAMAVVAKLKERASAAKGDAQWAYFDAMQHAKVVAYGERHLRGMATGGPASWNARVEHFTNTVSRLLNLHGADSKGIVWAHNTHIGDARATSMVSSGQTNIGQLARQRYGDDAVFALGFATAGGSVVAARQWEGARENMQIPTPPADSLEGLLGEHFSEPTVFLFSLDPTASETLARPILHRAIGVVYHPEREQFGNFVPTRLARRYDALIFLPVTRSLEPLE